MFPWHRRPRPPHGPHGHRAWGRGHRHPRGGLQRRLFWALFGGVLLTGAVTLAISSVTDTSFRSGYERLTRWLGVQFGRDWDQPAQLQRFVDETASTLGAHVEVRDLSGSLVAATPGRCVGKPLRLDVLQHERRVGEAKVCWEREGFHPRGLLYVGGALLVLWLLAGRLARRLARPLSELATVVQRIGEGELGARAQLGCHAPDEIGVVAHAVNDMAAKLERQSKSQRELLASVSHELRTPLSRIRLLSELARGQAGSEGSGPHAKALDDIDHEVNELDGLVGQLLASSRLDFEQVTKRRLSVRDVAARALERAGLEAKRLTVRLADGAATAGADTDGGDALDADPTLLQRALANLLDNAQKHGGGAEQLEVAASSDARGRWLSFAVLDRGPGLPRTGEALFAPFSPEQERRGQGGSSDEAGGRGDGLGLGLALVRRIALAHGGSVFAEPREGGGAKVGFSLPAPPSEPSPAGGV